MMSQFKSMRDRQLGRTKMAKHCIELLHLDTAPVNSAHYQASPVSREIKRAEVDKMLAENIIEHARTEWVARIVSLLKKDGTFQFYVDYRKRNADTKWDSNPDTTHLQMH